MQFSTSFPSGLDVGGGIPGGCGRGADGADVGDRKARREYPAVSRVLGCFVELTGTLSGK